MEKVIFSIDNCHDLHTMAKFLRHADTKRALDDLSENFDLLIDSYKGKLEYSFICGYDDFMNYFVNSGYLRNQETIVIITTTSNGRTSPSQLATLEYLDTTKKEKLGELRCVSKATALTKEAWTYEPRTGLYFITE